MNNVDPVYHMESFIEQRFVKSPDSLITLADAYWIYQIWCSERKAYPKSKIAFSRSLRDLGYTVKPTGNKNVVCVEGILLSTSDDLF